MNKYNLKDYSTAEEALQIINNRPAEFVSLIIHLDLENTKKSLQVLREINPPPSRLCLGNGPFTRGELQLDEDQFSLDIMQAISNLPVSELELSVSFLSRRSKESRRSNRTHQYPT